MIELVSAERCTACNICVEVCPTRVFDAVPGAAPAISRQGDCQTCFMCELYCPADALYVAPTAERLTFADAVADAVAEAEAEAGSAITTEAALVAKGLVGSYRRAVGWHAGARPAAAQDRSHALPESLAR